MEPSEARTQLLEEHTALRERMNRTASLAARLLLDAPVEADFTRELAGLRDAFAKHNTLEESYLVPFLRDADAWGPIRVERMVEAHRQEHVALRKILEGEPREVAQRMSDIIEDLEAHMQHEERTFLSPAVLKDDLINVGPTS
jgi:iron-sulfur cluster repair protein YtfE (RIC family)